MIVFIQARSNSKRFDKKVLKIIYGLPLIIHVVNNVKKSKSVKDIIVATSKNSSDNNLIKLLKNFKIRFFRGELENVVLRFVRLAMKIKCKYFMRISGDSPLIDNKIIEYAIKIHKKNKNFDIITNVFPRTFPKGQSVEIIKVQILKDYINKMSKSDLEHVTRYFYKNSSKFKIKNFKSKNKKKVMKLSVDTISDFIKIKKKIDKRKFLNFGL
jgi:spore coat polysaccharide biosynthesis protein SpsF